jgi:hypothetical protein
MSLAVASLLAPPGDFAMDSSAANVEALRRCFEFKTKDSQHILHHVNALVGAIRHYGIAGNSATPANDHSLHIAHELLAICRHVKDAIDAASD